MRPAPLGPRAGMPPEMASPLTILAVLWVGIYGLDLVGVTAAAAALLLGRAASVAYQVRPVARALSA